MNAVTDRDEGATATQRSQKFSPTKGAGTTGTHMQNANPDTDPTPVTQTHSKWITGLNVKCKPLKLTEENTGENLDDLGFGNDDFLGTTPKAGSMKERTGKVGFITMKHFCSVKDSVKRLRRQTTDRENICKRCV